MSVRGIEGHHEFPGASRALGGVGGHRCSGPPAAGPAMRDAATATKTAAAVGLLRCRRWPIVNGRCWQRAPETLPKARNPR
jgi:hypothetical protein